MPETGLSGSMSGVFVVSFLVSLANLLLAIYHQRWRSLLQNLLVGPIFQVRMATISGLACWTIWKGKTLEDFC